MGTGEAEHPARRANRLSLAAVLFFAAVVVVCAVLALTLIQREPPKLDLLIRTDSVQFSADEPIVVHARLVNNDVGPVPILHPAVDDLTFELIVVDDEGHRYEKRILFEVGSRPEPVLRELQPGDQVTVDEDIRSGYGIIPGKRYRIRGAYRTLNYPDENVWYGIIKSNRLDISVQSD